MHIERKRWRFTTGRSLTDEEYFLQCVDNERLRHIVWHVIERIPDYARYVLRGKNVVVVEDEYIMAEGAVGGAVQVPSDDGTGPYHLIRISPYIESDALCTLVVAHECAHVVLGHADIVVLQGMTPYSQDEVSTLDLLAEEHASYQAYMWGFEQETEVVFAGWSREEMPRWWQALHVSSTGNGSSECNRNGREPPHQV